MFPRVFLLSLRRKICLIVCTRLASSDIRAYLERLNTECAFNLSCLEGSLTTGGLWQHFDCNLVVK